MKTVLGVIAFIALGMTAADAATLNLSGVLNTATHMVGYYCDPRTVPEPTTWALAILGFAFLANRVRAIVKAKA